MKRSRDRGSILVLALLVSAAAAIAGMWLVRTSDLRNRASRYLARAGDATRYALSGLELSRLELGNSATGNWEGDTFQFDAHEGLPAVAAVTADSVGYLRSRVDATGTVGDSTQTVTAELRAPADISLEFNVVSATTLSFEDCAVGGHFRANGNVVASGNVEFSGNIETLSTATVTNQIAAGQVAYVSDVLGPPDVSITTLANACSPMLGVVFSTPDNALLIERARFTPTYNPYGATNAAGAYVLDAAGKNVTLREVFVSGMLVIRNAANVLIDRGYYHERADASYPTLVVEGNLDVRLEASLIEPALLQDLNADGDLIDVFLPSIAGIVYVSGTLRLPSAGKIHGTAMGHAVTIVGKSTIEDDPQLATLPVRQFVQAGAYDVVAGTIGEIQ